MNRSSGTANVIDVDTGGTFTDGVFRLNGAAISVKVDTTPHDPVRCFVECLEAGAAKLNAELDALLRATEVIRYSTTAATNAIIQRKGTRIGLLVSQGAEPDLYQHGTGAPVWKFVEPELVRGVREEVGQDGRLTRELDAEQFRTAVEELLDAGARLLIVALRNAGKNPSNELWARELFRRWFPTYYLGTPFLLLSHQVSPRGSDPERLNSALISGYLHRELVGYLYRCDAALRTRGFPRPLLIVHSSGGLARVAKTSALHTYNSGPTAGVFGAAKIARRYGLKRVVSMDMGGTSTDVALLEDGEPKLSFQTEVEELRLSLPMVDVIGLGGGGGSIAAIKDGTLQVGPESTGALPGPACYDLGNTLPTVTDADVVLGFLAVDNFLGGRRLLNAERSNKALEENVSRLMGMSLADGALRVRSTLARKLALEISREAEKRSFDLRSAELFAYGGAGPLHAADLAACLGISSFYVFPESPVFSAAGCASMSVSHYYESAVRPREGESFHECLRGEMDRLTDRARRDIRGEGFDESACTFSFQLETADGDVHSLASGSVPDSPQLSVVAEGVLALKATAQQPQETGSALQWTGDGTGNSKRPVTWGTGLHDTPVLSFFSLKEKEEVAGPVLLESGETCCAVPKGWRASRDAFGAVRVSQVAAPDAGTEGVSKP